MNRRRHSRIPPQLGVVFAASMLAASLQASLPRTSRPASQVPEPAALVVDAILEAESALQANELQVAESRYRTALLEGWLLLGALQVAENDFAAARTAFEKAATVAFMARRAELSLAAIELETGAPVAAISRLRRVIHGNLTDVEARRLLAQALAANGQIEESVQEMEEMRINFPDDLETLFLLGTAYLNQERIEAAEPVMAELATRQPSAQTLILIGRTLRDFDHFALARAALEQALEMDPEVLRAHYYLGTIEFLEHGLAGLTDAIVQFQAERLVSPEDPSTNLHLGMALVEERREEEAIPPLEAASAYPDAERNALHFLSRAYIRVGRNEDAIVTLTRALELAEADAALEPADSVDTHFQRQMSQLHFQFGVALRNLGDQEAAAVHFKAAENSFAREFENSQERLRRYLEDEAGEKRQEIFSSPLESPVIAGLSAPERLDLRGMLSRRLAQAYLNLGVLQAQEQQFARAGDLFKLAANLEPEYPRVQYSLGVARFNAGQFDQATTPLARARELDPENPQIRRMLALAWLSSDHYEEAAELLQYDTGRASDRSLQYAYGVALVRSGRAAEASLVFGSLLDKYQDWPELNVVLAQAQAQQDDYLGAVETLEKAIELRPDVPEAHSTLGEIYLRQGNLEEAERELRTELRSNPQDQRARMTLATVLDLAGRPDEAVEALLELLDSKPRASNARYLLGKILLAEGQPDKALVQLEAAARLAPTDPEIHYQLGLALQRQGRTEEAREVFATYQTLKRGKG